MAIIRDAFEILSAVVKELPRRVQTAMGCMPNYHLAILAIAVPKASPEKMIDDHPILRGSQPEDLDHTLPLTVFEDAGPYAVGHSAIIISMGSPMSWGDEKIT